jgi:hypothetical protein
MREEQLGNAYAVLLAAPEATSKPLSGLVD